MQTLRSLCVPACGLALLLLTVEGCTQLDRKHETSLAPETARLVLTPVDGLQEKSASPPVKPLRSVTDHERVQESIIELVQNANNLLQPLFPEQRDWDRIHSLSEFIEKEPLLRRQATPVHVEAFEGAANLSGFFGSITPRPKGGRLTTAQADIALQHARRLLTEAEILSAQLAVLDGPHRDLDDGFSLSASQKFDASQRSAGSAEDTKDRPIWDQGKLFRMPLSDNVTTSSSKLTADVPLPIGAHSKPSRSVKHDKRAGKFSGALSAKLLDTTPRLLPELNVQMRTRQGAVLRALDQVTTGSVGISAPKTAVVDEPFAVVLKVSVDKLAVILEELAAEVPENQTRTGKENVKLTPRMSASLAGLGFEITPQGSVAQPVLQTESTTWQWQAKAKEAGTLSLYFTLSQTMIVEGKEVARNYPFRKTLLVEVKPFDFREFTVTNWQWCISILLLPFAKLVWDMHVKPIPPDAALPRLTFAKIRSRLQFRRGQRK